MTRFSILLASALAIASTAWPFAASAQDSSDPTVTPPKNPPSRYKPIPPPRTLSIPPSKPKEIGKVPSGAVTIEKDVLGDRHRGTIGDVGLPGVGLPGEFGVSPPAPRPIPIGPAPR